MAEARPVGSLAAALPGAPDAERAGAWQQLADLLVAAGRRDQALLAARTALALHEGAGGGEDGAGVSRRSVELLTGPDVVPLHVAMGAEGVRGDGAELRAVWLGAPADPVLAMLGWVERDGTVDVVRVVVPGTRRGRSAFAVLLRALPEFVPVRLRLPARDTALVRLCTRAGFAAGEVGDEPGAHVGGTVHLLRAADPGTRESGPTVTATGA